jgi:transcription-repair coupling factor (superfamily II helicase)
MKIPQALILVGDPDRLVATVQDLRALAPPRQEVLALPGPLALEGVTVPMSWSDGMQRLKTLETLTRRSKIWVVATLEAALCPVLSPRRFRAMTTRVRVGDEVDREELLEKLVERGYRRQDSVTSPGEFAARGGIVDVFPPTSEAPIRIELFGDEVDCLRRFNPATQRSTEDVKETRLGPAWELPERHRLRALSDQGALPVEVEEAARHLLLGEGEGDSSLVLRHLRDDAGLPVDYLAKGAPVISFLTGLDAGRARAHHQSLFPDQDPYQMLREASGEHPFWDLTGSGAFGHVAPLDPGIRAAPAYSGNLPRFLEDVCTWTRGGEKVAIALGERGRLDRTRELLEEQGLEVLSGAGTPLSPGKVVLMDLDLESGFRFPDQEFHLLGAANLWGERNLRTATPKPQTERGARFSDFTEIEEGCMVVHVDHGIGKFLGVKPMLVDGLRQDFLELEYAKGDKLFVPTSQLDRVQRFIGVEGGHGPQANRLNSTRWAQARSKVRADVEEIAKELLELYAKRERAQGVRFSPDTVWQRELEESFPYQDTQDQTRATQTLKEDMERSRPMDRLICGDVGFGKTEVAIRAAFKAVQDSYQVAILCPTTVLAQQHYRTFSQRLGDFPVRIAAVSRLRDPKEIRTTLGKVKRGEIDILIGTHRLLSKDVRFKKLGLLVIDEEQRFGVKHKERIKEFKASVDVLTLTATPIPRTLNMALSGARDISTIATPPRGRLPVRTYVQPSEDPIIRGAIEKELSRGGQVFFVHNRIETLGKVTQWLQRLVPDARIRGGHAQMDRRALETLMLDFYEGAFDVLVSTTIVENGLDIPNVNTILVDRADRLGLSQLYQLRGRVGRTTRQAYAYLLYPAHMAVSELAYKRLKTMEEFTELGSGFRVAMRDLELRGAGSILGVSQSGFVNSVGFELYTRLLREAVAKLGGNPEDAPAEPTVLEMPLQAYLPEDYIPGDEERLQAYRSLAEILDTSELQDFQRELVDRYGSLPDSLNGLFEMVHIKIRATNLGFASIKQTGSFLKVHLKPETNLPPKVVERLMRRFRRRIQFHPEGFNLSVAGWPRARVFEVVERLLSDMEATPQESLSPSA